MQSVPASHGAIVVGILPLATAIAGTSLAIWLVSLIGTALVIGYTLLQGNGLFHKADTVKGNVVVQKDKNLELDPSFYERQKKLQKTR